MGLQSHGSGEDLLLIDVIEISEDEPQDSFMYCNTTDPNPNTNTNTNTNPNPNTTDTTDTTDTTNTTDTTDMDHSDGEYEMYNPLDDYF